VECIYILWIPPLIKIHNISILLDKLFSWYVPYSPNCMIWFDISNNNYFDYSFVICFSYNSNQNFLKSFKLWVTWRELFSIDSIYRCVEDTLILFFTFELLILQFTIQKVILPVLNSRFFNHALHIHEMCFWRDTGSFLFRYKLKGITLIALRDFKIALKSFKITTN
jgi:hypothetical protein